jgi:hypothetical protein
MSNLKTVEDIRTDQKMIISELTELELELDNMLANPGAQQNLKSIYDY